MHVFAQLLNERPVIRPAVNFEHACAREKQLSKAHAVLPRVVYKREDVVRDRPQSPHVRRRDLSILRRGELRHRSEFGQRSFVSRCTSGAQRIGEVQIRPIAAFELAVRLLQLEAAAVLRAG